MSWFPKREKLNPKQASEYPPAVRPLAKQVARVVLTLPWRRTETSTCRARPIHTTTKRIGPHWWGREWWSSYKLLSIFAALQIWTVILNARKSTRPHCGAGQTGLLQFCKIRVSLV